MIQSVNIADGFYNSPIARSPSENRPAMRRDVNPIRRKLAAIIAADVAGYSRLMSLDESGTVKALAEIRTIFDQLIQEFGGRIANTAGDSVLAEFTSALDAAECCISVQLKIEERAAGLPEGIALRFRIGIHLGDVVVQGNDLLGDGVNIAARLEAIAEPGGICISGHVLDQIDGKVDFPIRPLGLQILKNIAKPVDAYAIQLRRSSATPDTKLPSSPRFQQEVRYCRSADGVRLAYSVVGSGPPLLKTANWINHLELDWELPLYRHLFSGLAKQYTLIRYDARGNGLFRLGPERIVGGCLGERPGNGRKCSRPRTLSDFWLLSRVCHLNCICRSPPQPSFSTGFVGWFRTRQI